jgi:hypothetical protein
MRAVFFTTKRLAQRSARSMAGAWFAPQDPRALAVCRVILFWFIWPGLKLPHYAQYADLRDSAWYPVSFFSLGVPLLSRGTLEVMSAVFSVASLCALTGFLYPFTAPLTAVLTVYFLGLPQNFGKINHDGLVPMALLVLGLARSADVWSIDAWLKRRIFPRAAAESASRGRQFSGEYRWPIQFLALLVVSMYGAAGWTKLLKAGWDWAFSDSFRLLLLRHHFTHQPVTEIGVWLANFPTVCQWLAFGAMFIEILCPLALLSPWMYRIFIPSLALMQLSIWLLMGVLFRHMVYVFLCLLPWSGALVWLDVARAKLVARLPGTGRLLQRGSRVDHYLRR